MVHGARREAVDTPLASPDVPAPASREDTRRRILDKIGLMAAGVAVAILHGSGRARRRPWRRRWTSRPAPGNAARAAAPSGAVPPSASAGGALNLDNTASTGAGAVLYSNQGAGALGRLLVVNQANPANPQQPCGYRTPAPRTPSRSTTTRPAAPGTRPPRRSTSSRPTRSTRRSGCRAASRAGARSRSRTRSRRGPTPTRRHSRSRCWARGPQARASS